MRRNTVTLAFGSCGVLALIGGLFGADPSKSEAPRNNDLQARVRFEKEIRPLLAARCVKCHGPEKQEGGLRLDRREAAFRGGDLGAVIVPGKAAESELIRRITADDENVRMPPPDEKGKSTPLTAAEIMQLTEWINQNAQWPADKTEDAATRHWAFQPIADQQLPEVQNREWPRGAIDRFILAKLESQGIAPSPEADRYTLIRRVYYDLIGLPPTIDEVDEFLGDTSPNAYEKLVERVLGSPHFGERWGRDWLDKARYADSDGYEKDNSRPDAWRYRDWVIDAVNADMPFDEFTVEQIAGDLLPNATPMQQLATAFHRQTLTNTEGGTDQEQFRVEAVFDRVSTTGTVWLGLTVGCAQCHSHKYDPITQREYYQLFAFFNNGDETTAEVPISDEAVVRYEREKQKHDLQMERIKQQLSSRRAELASTLPDWERRVSASFQSASTSSVVPLVQFHPLNTKSIKSEGKAEFRRLDDGSYLVSGPSPAKDKYTLVAQAGIEKITGFRVTALSDASLPGSGPGRASNGNFVLGEIRIATSTAEDAKDWRHVSLVAGRSDFAQESFSASQAVDENERTGWAIAPQTGRDHSAVFVISDTPIDSKSAGWLRIELEQPHGESHTLGRFRIEIMTGNDPRIELPEDVSQILTVVPEKRSAQQNELLLDAVVVRDQAYRQLKRQLSEHQQHIPARPVLNARVIHQRTENPRKTHLLRRGDFLQPQGEVVPATFSLLHAFSPRQQNATADRLDLARWLVDPKNPLTSRVVSNQIWARLFGHGLVSTLNDFGTRGEKPSHAELLDWLAREYQRVGWSRKTLIRRIVTSAAYRQASLNRSEMVDIDPQNGLLWRQNRLRVEAEIVRDLHLAVSDRLAKKIGGPSVFPPMPPDVAALSYANNFKWNTSSGLDRYRRGMYTFFKRTAPHPNLTTFDCPDANTTAVERSTSNTPLQALTTLNNDTFVEAAQTLTRVLLLEPATEDKQRIERAFRRCVARPPSATEQSAFLELLADSRTWYAAHPDEAKSAIRGQQLDNVSPQETAAWLATVRIILNMDEFITRE